jgi:hypothetical protein
MNNLKIIVKVNFINIIIVSQGIICLIIIKKYKRNIEN